MKTGNMFHRIKIKRYNFDNCSHDCRMVELDATIAFVVQGNVRHVKIFWDRNHRTNNSFRIN